MVSVHELASLETEPSGEDLELFQESKEALAIIRCPSCQGLRSIAQRNHKTNALCKDCRSGNVVPRWTFCSFWVERFTQKEIDEMARTIWG